VGLFASLRTQKIEGFEELNEVVLGTRREIVQLEGGKIKGEIAHATIGDLPIDTASFNLGIRTKRRIAQEPDWYRPARRKR
jgi:hypothetical protein